MRLTLKQLLGLVALASVLCLVVAWQLKSRALDFWGYSKLGVSQGTVGSPVYYLEVRGVADLPTVVRVVRFEDSQAAPRNALAVSHAVSTEFDTHTQNVDRWSRQCVLIAGRTNDEKIEIPLDPKTARSLFGRPGKQFEKYSVMEKMWEDHIEPQLTAEGS